MWIFTRYGFYSIACASKPDGSLDTQSVMVRARCKTHLTSLQNRFPKAAFGELFEFPHADYRYRLVLSKASWTVIVGELVKEQEWSNFKNEVANFQGAAGRAYVRVLHDVWETMYRLQPDRDQQ